MLLSSRLPVFSSPHPKSRHPERSAAESKDPDATRPTDTDRTFSTNNAVALAVAFALAVALASEIGPGLEPGLYRTTNKLGFSPRGYALLSRALLDTRYTIKTQGKINPEPIRAPAKPIAATVLSQFNPAMEQLMGME